MDFFEIKNSLRRIGPDKYIIGQQAFDPLVLIDGKRIETYQIDVKILNFETGFFTSLSGQKLDVISGFVESAYIDNLVLKTGLFDNLSGETFETISGYTHNSQIDNLTLKTGLFDNLSGETFETISGYTHNSQIDNLTLKTGVFDDLSGVNFNFNSGSISYSFIGDLNIKTGSAEKFYISGIDILQFILDLSGNLESTGLHLHGHIDTLSGNLESTGLHLHGHIDTLSGNLESTGLHLHGHIDTLSGNLESTGLHLHGHIDTLSGKIQALSQNTGSQILSGNYEENRLLLEEAFEEDEYGDIAPTNHPFISDPMWILKEDNNLELRANVWRYNTGPEAFTDDISF